jgi:hypothetical protein
MEQLGMDRADATSEPHLGSGQASIFETAPTEAAPTEPTATEPAADGPAAEAATPEWADGEPAADEHEEPAAEEHQEHEVHEDEEPLPDVPDPPHTGDPAVDQVISAVAAAVGGPLEEQLAAYDTAHRTLQDRLADVEG